MSTSNDRRYCSYRVLELASGKAVARVVQYNMRSGGKALSDAEISMDNVTIDTFGHN